MRTRFFGCVIWRNPCHGWDYIESCAPMQRDESTETVALYTWEMGTVATIGIVAVFDKSYPSLFIWQWNRGDCHLLKLIASEWHWRG